MFTGVGVALVTLFDDAGDVDLDATAAHAADLAGRGVRAIVLAGSTGEAAALDGAERVALTTVVRDAVPDDVPVLVGTGAPSARQAARLSAEVVAAGSAAVLALSGPGATDPVPYYREVVAAVAGAVPVLAYHFPAMSAPGVGVEALAALADVGVAGIKDSSGDMSRLLRTLDVFPGWLFVGSPWLLSAAGALGVTGAILAVANVEPETAAHAFAGDVAAQRRLTPVNGRAAGPLGVKSVLAERWGRTLPVRVG
ncbi:MAG: dihydrodipicolinate synthase family protein [Ilumatobacteraceae bacterium]